MRAGAAARAQRRRSEEGEGGLRRRGRAESRVWRREGEGRGDLRSQA